MELFYEVIPVPLFCQVFSRRMRGNPEGSKRVTVNSNITGTGR